MKKKVLILAAVLTLGCAANSFAAAVAFTWLSAGTATDNGGGNQDMAVTSPVPQLTFKPSAGVVVGYSSHANGLSYSLGTYHTTGTFTYATTSTDTNIYRYPNGTGNGVQSAVQKGPDAPATATTQYDWTSVAGVAWTASK